MKEQMALAVFRRDEGGYSAWLVAHPRGYVFNHFGGAGAADNVLHRAHCPWLARPEDHGRRTVVEKVCGVSYTDILEEVNRRRPEPRGWTQCATCMGE